MLIVELIWSMILLSLGHKLGKSFMNKDWLIVKHAKLRYVYDMGDESSYDRGQGYGDLEIQVDDSHDTTKWVQNEVEGVEVTPKMEVSM